MAESIKIITGIVRLSYPHICEKSDKGKYGASLIIPKSDSKTISEINKACEELKSVFKAKNGKLPANFKMPLRDGDAEKEDDGAYSESMFINANSDRRPGLVDKNLKEIIDPDEVYAGCYCRASIMLYLFDKEGNRGIACGLNNLQKVKDGEPLAGGASAEDDFKEFAAVEEDDLL